jgi:hypothetical protein
MLIEIICPICKSKKQLNIPESIINQSKQLTAVSIQKGMLCNHHFQLFIDKNFKVRGYQKIDFEVSPIKKRDKIFNVEQKGNSKNADNELFENLIMEGNYVEYKPNSLKSNDVSFISKTSGTSKRRKDLTLKEIYELFWDFIDEDNRQFRELIIKDKRRKHLERTLKPLKH